MRIALAQLAASPDRAANLARCLETMTAAAQAGAELITFPEVILDPFFPQYPGTPRLWISPSRFPVPRPRGSPSAPASWGW